MSAVLAAASCGSAAIRKAIRGPSDAHVGRPAAYVDKLLIEGRGGVHHIWACDHYKTTLNALKLKQVYKRRTDMVKDAMNTVPWGDRKAMVDAIMMAIRQGGLFSVDVDIVPTPDRPGVPCLAAGGDLGRDEPHLDERRAAHAAHRALHGPAGQRAARLPDRRASRQRHGACAARAGQGRLRRPVQGLRLEDGGGRLHRRLRQAREGRRARHLCPAEGDGQQRLPGTCDRVSPTRRSSAPSGSTPTASSRPRTARPSSWRRPGAACRRPARPSRRPSTGSSSTTDGPTWSGRTRSWTSTTTS